MEDIHVIEHIKEICKYRGWTYYKLAKESGIPHSSLSTMLNKQHIPSMANLIKICQGFDITLSQFFASMETPTNRQEELINIWTLLDEQAKELLMTYAYGLSHKEIRGEIH